MHLEIRKEHYLFDFQVKSFLSCKESYAFRVTLEVLTNKSRCLDEIARDCMRGMHLDKQVPREMFLQ